MTLAAIGALVLGMVLGYLAHYMVRRDQQAGVGELAVVIAALLGAAVFKVITGQDQTSWYLIGLGVGFFLYWFQLLLSREQIKKLIQEKKQLPIAPLMRQS